MFKNVFNLVCYLFGFPPFTLNIYLLDKKNSVYVKNKKNSRRPNVFA